MFRAIEMKTTITQVLTRREGREMGVGCKEHSCEVRG